METTPAGKPIVDREKVCELPTEWKLKFIPISSVDRAFPHPRVPKSWDLPSVKPVRGWANTHRG